MKNFYKSYVSLLLLSSFISAISFQSQAQTLGVSAGAGMMSLYDFHDNSTYFYAHYKSGSHQFVKLDFSDILPGKYFPRLYVNFDRSSGYIETSGEPFMICGLGFDYYNQSSLNTTFTLYRMGIGIMPLDVNLYKGIKLSAGMEFSSILRSEYADPLGYEISADLVFPNRGLVPHRIRRDQDVINNMGLGLTFELQLGEFYLGDSFGLHPVYNASFGLLEEFKTNFTTRSIRQSLGLAFKWH